nr:MAG TPA: hypothetical protein [Bacteriophage sp.]
MRLVFSYKERLYHHPVFITGAYHFDSLEPTLFRDSR